MQHPETRTFEHARQIATQFETALGSYGITIAPKSELEAAVFEMMDLEDRRTGRSPVIPGEDIRASISRTLGILHLAEMIVSAHARGRQLHTIVPHLKLLNKGVVAQNVRRIGDEAANKLFEALIGLACMLFATQVRLDDPEHSEGDNPDVMCQFQAEEWALACKVPNGDSMISAFENIEHAVKQIDRSGAKRGLVVLNARNWIDHHAIWRPPGGDVIGKPEEKDIHWAWLTPEMPFGLLRMESDRRYEAILDAKGDEIIELFESFQRTVPSVLVFLQSATLVATSHGPVMTRVGTFATWPFAKTERSSDVAMLHALNGAMFRLPQIPDLQSPP